MPSFIFTAAKMTRKYCSTSFLPYFLKFRGFNSHRNRTYHHHHHHHHDWSWL